MFLNGRDVKFKFTVGASFEIADLCPEGKIENIEKLWQGTYRENAENEIQFMIALNKGYIDAQKFIDPKFADKPLTKEELLYLDNNEYQKLSQEALAAYLGDSKRKVDTAPVKSKKKAAAGAVKK